MKYSVSLSNTYVSSSWQKEILTFLPNDCIFIVSIITFLCNKSLISMVEMNKNIDQESLFNVEWFQGSFNVSCQRS